MVMSVKYKMEIHTPSVVKPELLAVTSKGGVPLVRICDDKWENDCFKLESGIMSATISSFNKQFKTDLAQIYCENHSIFIKRSNNFIVYILVENSLKYNEKQAGFYMNNLLDILEKLYHKNNDIIISKSKLEYCVYDFYYHYLLLTRHFSCNYQNSLKNEYIIKECELIG